MDAAEAKIARRACLAVMLSAAGADGCALTADNESTVRAAMVAIVPEVRFVGASPLALALEYGLLCARRRLAGFKLPQVDLVARGLGIGRVGQQLQIVLHMIGGVGVEAQFTG